MSIRACRIESIIRNDENQIDVQWHLAFLSGGQWARNLNGRAHQSMIPVRINPLSGQN